MSCWHYHHCRWVRVIGLSSRWKCVWRCSSSLTHAVHIVTRSVSGETELDKSPNGAKHVAELCLRLVSFDNLSLTLPRPLFSTTAQKVGCDTIAGSDDLAFPTAFELQRQNPTWLDSAIGDFLIPKRQSRVPTQRKCCRVSVTFEPHMTANLL